MRKINTILAGIITLLFLQHAFSGSLYLLGFNVKVVSPLSYLMAILVLIHAVLSILLTVRSLKARNNTKADYQKDNRLYWLRRDSGIAILVFALIHVISMQRMADGRPLAAKMGIWSTVDLFALVTSVVVHILANIRPLLISLGFKDSERRRILLSALVIMLCILVFIAGIVFRIRRHG